MANATHQPLIQLQNFTTLGRQNLESNNPKTCLPVLFVEAVSMKTRMSTPQKAASVVHESSRWPSVGSLSSRPSCRPEL